MNQLLSLQDSCHIQTFSAHNFWIDHFAYNMNYDTSCDRPSDHDASCNKDNGCNIHRNTTDYNNYSPRDCNNTSSNPNSMNYNNRNRMVCILRNNKDLSKLVLPMHRCHPHIHSSRMDQGNKCRYNKDPRMRWLYVDCEICLCAGHNNNLIAYR